MNCDTVRISNAAGGSRDLQLGREVEKFSRCRGGFVKKPGIGNIHAAPAICDGVIREPDSRPVCGPVDSLPRFPLPRHDSKISAQMTKHDDFSTAQLRDRSGTAVRLLPNRPGGSIEELDNAVRGHFRDKQSAADFNGTLWIAGGKRGHSIKPDFPGQSARTPE